ncbi:hypothetical protein HYDPIDRAFT_42675 [Hydnomerulius pinastri MD-312]|uniref:Uncharacterized protein n=1 Tax=Hydnomerulius pinastri MD-312 TaxID=994086 RepID=A0A0C9V744_9AGAM|nr:hypothetical protein HYDPIDRAFT_42675 [Hydnomerulius pinastri MD-312]
MSCQPPVLHEVTEASPWPQQVQNVAHLLRQPLPSRVYSGPYPYASNMCSSLLDELAQKRPPSSPSSSEDQTSRADRVFDLVLSTVATLRALAQLKDDPRPTTPLWSSLIRGLGYALTEDATIICETPFVRPRFPSVIEQEVMDGTATVLISYIIKDSGDVQPSGSADMRLDPRSTFSRSKRGSRDVYADTDDSSSSCSSDHSSDRSSSSIHVPVDAHVIPGQGRRGCVVLPVICVADSDNIMSLLGSVLYQRRLWGIDEPVVGIECSKYGTMARVFLGWLSDERAHNCSLPIVHIARCIASAPSDAIGLFDLTQPASALALAQFILGLDCHFRAIVSGRVLKSELDTLCWRADHFHECPNKFEGDHDGEQWKDRIVKWVQDVDKLDVAELPYKPSHHDLALPIPIMEFSKLADIPEAPEQSGSVHDDRIDRGRSRTRKSGSAKPENTAQSRSQSRYSNSRFARGDGGDLDGDASINTWLFERNAFTIGRIKLSGEATDSAEINAMIDHYDSMTKFVWPQTWNAEVKLPEVDGAVKELKVELFRQYSDISQKTWARAPLDDRHVRALSDWLSALLFSTVGMYTLYANKARPVVYEAEARHEWDTLLYRFYVSQSESVSQTAFLERNLNLPRNTAVDHDNDSLFDQQKALANGYVAHCTAAQFALVSQPGLDLNASLLSQGDKEVGVLGVAIQASSQALNSLMQVPKSPGMRARVIEHAMVEPTQGKCDAILVVPVDSKLPLELALVQQSQKSQEPGLPESSKTSSKRPQPHSAVRTNKTNKTVLRDPVASSCREPIPEANYGILPQTLEGNVLLPSLVAEYKKHEHSPMAALNQGRIYCVAAVTFLAALGIEEYPVYGLVTNGNVGAVLLSWKSPASKNIYIMERSIRTFNLSRPIEAFQFAAFLLRLRDKDDELRRVFQERSYVRNGQAVTRWTMQEQISLLNAKQS